MAIAFDAFSNSSEGTTNLSWTHTPVGAPKGVVVFIVQSGSATDEITGVTYGGQAMTRVTIATDSVTEVGITYAYFLGSSIPTGAQTVEVTVSGASTKIAGAFTTTAASDTEVETSNIRENNMQNPSVTLTTGAGVACFIAAGLFSGIDTPSVNQTPAADLTEHLEYDIASTNSVASFARRTDNSTGGEVTVAWTTVANEDVALVGIALKEGPVAGPTPPVGSAVFGGVAGLWDLGVVVPTELT